MKKYNLIQYCHSKKLKFNENYFGNNNFMHFEFDIYRTGNQQN
jgi:hypothetical protein